MRIAVVANTAWYVANFRMNLMAALRSDGHEVMAITPSGEDVDRITAEGFAHYAFPLSGRGTHPLEEASSVLALRRLLRRHTVDLVLSSTPKGNIYAALARTGLPCRQVVNVSGLGSSFIRQNWLTLVVRALYRLTFRSIDRVFFENEDDRQLFLRWGIVKPSAAIRIPGLGVDLRRFEQVPLPDQREVTFLMVARLLGDKGTREYTSAARKVKQVCPGTRFLLLGPAGADNPSAISEAELAGWVRDGTIEYVGYHHDVRPFLRAATCVVLPSYREGMPRSLLEGAAMGRPLIATDVPGCREAIEDGGNGFLCRPRDSDSLAEAMMRIVRLPAIQRAALGDRSRQMVESGFSESIVLSRYRDTVEALK